MNKSDATLARLPTPALLLDIDILERNLTRMQARADDLDVRLRPHFKTHKCLQIADRQRRLGAHGFTVATLEEARALADGGFRDLIWAFPVIPSRIAEAAAIHATAGLGVVIDSEPAIHALEAAAFPGPVWLKVDCGYGRAGVDADEEFATRLARRVADSRLDFAGLLSHSGHAYDVTTDGEAAEIAEEERRVMTGFRDRLAHARIAGLELSVGSTPAVTRARSLEGIDEARPGNYALFDYTQTLLGSCEVRDCAATVLTTVVSSQPGAPHCITDSGSLSLSKDAGRDEPTHFGRILAPDGSSLDDRARIRKVSQEHGWLYPPLPVGTRVRVLPNHSCLTAALFDVFHVMRDGRVVDRWPIHRAH